MNQKHPVVQHPATDQPWLPSANSAQSASATKATRSTIAPVQSATRQSLRTRGA